VISEHLDATEALGAPRWQALVPAEAVPMGEPFGSETTNLAGARVPLVLVRVGGEIRAFDGHCPHRAGPLATLGAVDLETETLTCTWHCWVFRLSDGGHTHLDGVGLRRYPVRISAAGVVEVDVDRAPQPEGASR